MNTNEFFDKFTSNTLAGSSIQSFFLSDGTRKKGRVYYKIFKGGRCQYSLLFGNTVDSTFRTSGPSFGTELEEWTIHSLKVGKTASSSMEIAYEPSDFVDVYFSGARSKVVKTGENICCDPFELSVEDGEYLCVEIEFSGTKIPNHEELWFSAFVEEDGKWVSSVKLPVPSMVGCSRPVNKRVVYLGDSITQGIGSTKNSYNHWNAILSNMLGNDYSYWNLGIGCADSSDAACDKAWLNKAKNSDIVFLCLGVNDLGRGRNANEIIKNLDKIVDILKNNGRKIIIQTIPPFDYSKEKKEIWIECNKYIKENISKRVDGCFDCCSVLSKNEVENEIALYGGHPDDNGCKVWAKALYNYVIPIL